MSRQRDARMEGGAIFALFSYGTLQQAEVQLSTYKRLLAGRPDSLSGYRLAPLQIDDPEVVQLSGKAIHSIAVHSGDQRDRIDGTLFWMSEAELTATDRYEVEAYQRVEVRLDSGTRSFVYLQRNAGPSIDVKKV